MCGEIKWFSSLNLEAQCTEPEGHDMLDIKHRDKWEGVEW